MPDITMCDGGVCPRKTVCHRHTATPNEWRQSYFAEPPYKPGQGCAHFEPSEVVRGAFTKMTPRDIARLYEEVQDLKKEQS